MKIEKRRKKSKLTRVLIEKYQNQLDRPSRKKDWSYSKRESFFEKRQQQYKQTLNSEEAILVSSKKTRTVNSGRLT